MASTSTTSKAWIVSLTLSSALFSTPSAFGDQVIAGEFLTETSPMLDCENVLTD